MSGAARGAPAVELRRVRKGFGRAWTGRPRRALADVSLHVGAGTVAAVVGPNGAGKTTLLRLCAGLIRPESGELRILGRSPEQARAQGRVAFIGEGEVLPAHLPARTCLAAIGTIVGAAARSVDRVLRQLDLAADAGTSIGRLSRGRRQRLALATATLGSAELLLLDEPWCGIDPHAARRLTALLEGCRAEGRTVIYTTHLLAEAERLCDRFLVLVEGRCVWSGGREAVGRSGGLEAVYRAEVPE